MRELKVNINVWNLITDEVKAFNERTHFNYDMTMDEVLFSYLESTEDTVMFYDWDEGKNNDPYWDNEKNMHSCCSFLDEMNKKIKLL